LRPAKERAERVSAAAGSTTEEASDDESLLQMLMATIPGKVIDNRNQGDGGTGDSGVRECPGEGG
jgi:hypothetical protein